MTLVLEPTNLDLEVFIFEGLAIDAASASSIIVQEVTALNHKVFDNTMELTTFVPEWWLGVNTIKQLCEWDIRAIDPYIYKACPLTPCTNPLY